MGIGIRWQGMGMVARGSEKTGMGMKCCHDISLRMFLSIS